MEYVFIQRSGDRERIAEYLEELTQLSKIELVNRYNNAVRIGILGVHAQAQMIVALNLAFTKSFGSSPIKIDKNVIISLTGKIELNGENWNY
jgi:hypothetical protein